ncbi:type VII secretion integral membrane protein EccD [Arthrobacter sp. NPDC058097]|uniref:type VII secretion integral membrane protein EccD n=1 Tax=Arthrobacter sp. NPDC058097 TaxID=3346340 RepID=UPI0036DB4EBC
MSGALSRVTVIAPHRHLDLRLPSDEPVASLMPQILALMNDGTDGSPTRSFSGSGAVVRSTVLTTSLGIALENSLTLRQAGVPEGSLLYLRDERDVPPAPDVYDVPSFAAEATERIPALWAGALRTAGLSAVAGLLLVGAGASFVLLGPGGGYDGVLAGLIIAAILMLTGAVTGRWRSAPAGLALLCAGLAVSAAASIVAGPQPGALLFPGAVVLAMAGAAVATGRHVPFLSSAALLLALGGAWTVLAWSTGDQALAAALTGIAAIFALGVAPRLSTVLTGLSGLDDDQRQGKRISRNTTLDAVHSAHATLTGWTLTAATVAATSAIVTATATDRLPWAALLSIALLGVLTFRGLSLPLLAQRAGIYVAAAAACLGVTATFALTFGQPLLLCGPGAMGALVLIASIARVRPQAAARLRVAASRLELLCVLSTIPLVLGLSGAYTQLGQTFG